MINLIVARNSKNVIGQGTKIPWHCSEDFKHFKETTSGHIIAMGRKTFESLPKVLPNRIHYALTQDKTWTVPVGFNVDEIRKETSQVFMYRSIEGLVKDYKENVTREAAENKELFIVGGGTIYQEFLNRDLIDRVYLSKIYDDSDGDFFLSNEFDFPKWQLVSREDRGSFCLFIYDRIRNKGLNG